MKHQKDAMSLVDEQVYASVLSELESGEIRNGVWAKAFADSDGDENKAKAAYIRLRVQQEFYRASQNNDADTTADSPSYFNEAGNQTFRIEQGGDTVRNTGHNHDTKSMEDSSQEIELMADFGITYDGEFYLY